MQWKMVHFSNTFLHQNFCSLQLFSLQIAIARDLSWIKKKWGTVRNAIYHELGSWAHTLKETYNFSFWGYLSGCVEVPFNVGVVWQVLKGAFFFFTDAPWIFFLHICSLIFSLALLYFITVVQGIKSAEESGYCWVSRICMDVNKWDEQKYLCVYTCDILNRRYMQPSMFTSRLGCVHS